MMAFEVTLKELAYQAFNDGNHAILDFSNGKKVGYKTIVDRCVHTTPYHTSPIKFMHFNKTLSEYSRVEINHGVLDTQTIDNYFPILYAAPSRKPRWKFINGNGEKYAGDMKIVEDDFKRYIELKREYLKQKLQNLKKDKLSDVKRMEDEILKISHEAEERSSDWGYLFALEKDIILDRFIKKSNIEEFAKRFKFTYGREMEEEKRRAGVTSFTPIHIERDHQGDITFVDRVVRDNGIKYDISEYPEIKKVIEVAQKHNKVNETIRHYEEFHKLREKDSIPPQILILDLNDQYFLDDRNLSWLIR